MFLFIQKSVFDPNIGGEWKRMRLAEEVLRESLERTFQEYGASLDNVTALKYMGRVMTAGDYDWPAVVGNPQKARNSWGQMSLILIREGADTKVLGHLFKAVVQEVLLFGADMWVLNTRMERALSIFQCWAAVEIGRTKYRRAAVEIGRTKYRRSSVRIRRIKCLRIYDDLEVI